MTWGAPLWDVKAIDVKFYNMNFPVKDQSIYYHKVIINFSVY